MGVRSDAEAWNFFRELISRLGTRPSQRVHQDRIKSQEGSTGLPTAWRPARECFTYIIVKVDLYRRMIGAAPVYARILVGPRRNSGYSDLLIGRPGNFSPRCV